MGPKEEVLLWIGVAILVWLSIFVCSGLFLAAGCQRAYSICAILRSIPNKATIEWFYSKEAMDNRLMLASSRYYRSLPCVDS